MMQNPKYLSYAREYAKDYNTLLKHVPALAGLQEYWDTHTTAERVYSSTAMHAITIPLHSWSGSPSALISIVSAVYDLYNTEEHILVYDKDVWGKLLYSPYIRLTCYSCKQDSKFIQSLPAYKHNRFAASDYEYRYVITRHAEISTQTQQLTNIIDVLSMPLSYEGDSPMDLEHAHKVILTMQFHIRALLREVPRE